MPAARVALDHAADSYDGLEPPLAKNQTVLAMLIGGAVLAACFAWYMFDTKMVPGVVQLTTAPADAEVSFDGVSVGAVSPFIKTGVEPGTKHKLEVKKAGFRTWSQEVEVQPGQALVFTVALPPVAAEAPVVAPAPAAQVAAVAPTALPAAENPVAEPEPEAAIAPSAAAEPAAPAAKASAAAGAAVRRAARPAVSSGATGILRVSSRPWSIVTVDGKLIGNTPQMNLTLSAGTHRVQLSNPEFKIEKTVTVTIQPGKTETLIVNLP